MLLRTLAAGRLQTNCYVLACRRRREAMVVDPGGDLERILDTVGDLKVRVTQVVLTHYHFDHIEAADPLRAATGASLAIHHSEAAPLKDPPPLFRLLVANVPDGIVADRLLHDGDVLSVGDLKVQVLHTPGHSPGGVSLWLADEGIVFCGDTLFRGGVGRTDFPGSSPSVLSRSIRDRLFLLPEETVVYPGHGPPTTIGYERQHNPWVATKPG